MIDNNLNDNNNLDSGEGASEWEALARYLSGESTSAERAEVEAQLAVDPPRARLVAALGRVPAVSGVAPSSDVDIEAALARVRGRLREADVRPIGTARRTRTGRGHDPLESAWRTPLLRAAGIAALAAGAGVVYLRGARDAAPVAVADSGEVMVVATETARIDSLFLSDGSRVILGPGSTLAIHPDFGGSSRELTLRGEAMFDVLHDEAHPFIIHVPGGIVEDLGTTFSVRTGADEATRVVVAEGSVNLRSESRTGAGEVVLLPGDRGILPREGAPTAEHGSTVDEDFAWTRGILSFRDASIAEVDSELTRWYGYHFRVADPDLADRRLTAAFEGESPPQIGEIIALALGGRLELQGDTIVILPTGLR